MGDEIPSHNVQLSARGLFFVNEKKVGFPHNFLAFAGARGGFLVDDAMKHLDFEHYLRIDLARNFICDDMVSRLKTRNAPDVAVNCVNFTSVYVADQQSLPIYSAQGRQLFFNIVHFGDFRSFDAVSHGSLVVFVGGHDDFYHFVVFGRHRKRKVHEWVESDAHLAAFGIGTNDSAFQLALEQVHDDGLVSQEMSVPRFFAYYLVWSAVALLHFHVRLLLDFVEILVQAVQEECQKLLRIMLVVSTKLWCVFADAFL